MICKLVFACRVPRCSFCCGICKWVSARTVQHTEFWGKWSWRSYRGFEPNAAVTEKCIFSWLPLCHASHCLLICCLNEVFSSVAL
uniref:Uncharacterized protein n=1 Tax=Anguilla anguilla TaxID=7936 RepID=A0A0E9QQ50_ANGAN